MSVNTHASEIRLVKGNSIGSDETAFEDDTIRISINTTEDINQSIIRDGVVEIGSFSPTQSRPVKARIHQSIVGTKVTVTDFSPHTYN